MMFETMNMNTENVCKFWIKYLDMRTVSAKTVANVLKLDQRKESKSALIFINEVKNNGDC